jgi:hypothetical protein
MNRRLSLSRNVHTGHPAYDPADDANNAPVSFATCGRAGVDTRTPADDNTTPPESAST